MTNPSSLQKDNNFLSLVLSWLIKLTGIALFAYVLKDVNWKTCLDAISKISIFPLIISLSMIHIGYAIKAKRWQIILANYSTKLSIWELYKIFCIGTFLGIITPGKIGDFGRLYYIKDSIDLKKGLSSLFIDRIFDLIALGVLGGMAVFYFEWHFNIIESKVFMLGLKTKYAFIIGAIIILSTALIFSRKIISGLTLILNGVKSFFSFLKQLTITFLSMILIYGAFIIIAHDMGLEISYVGLFLGTILIGLLSLVPITILGLGVREVSMVYIFSLYNLSYDLAIAISLILFFIQLMATVPGIILFSKKPFRLNQIKK